MQPTLRLGKGNVYADALWRSQRPGLAWRAEPEMDALSVTPRRNNVSRGARAWALARTLFAAFSWRSASTVRPMSAKRKRGLTVDGCRLLSAEGRWRPLLSASARQHGNNVT